MIKKLPTFQKKDIFAVAAIACLLCLMFISKPQAQAQAIFNYQSRLTDSSGNPITVATTMRYCISTGSTLGGALGDCDTPTLGTSLIWHETYDGSSGSCPQITPDTQGFFNIAIGSCSALPTNLDFTNPLYLWVKVGSDSTATPPVQLNPAPIALQVGPAVAGTNKLTVLETGTATGAIQGYNSSSFVLQGSGWDSTLSSATTVTFSVANEVTDSSNYSYVIRNTNNVPVFTMDQSGIGTMAGSAQYTSASTAIVQYKVVKRVDSAIQGIPSVTTAANGDTPMGIVVDTFVQAQTPIAGEYYGSVLYYGRIEYNTTGQAVGDEVYFDNTGNITFTPQNKKIGTVINVGATGAIFIDTITTAEIDYDPTVLTAVTGVGNFTATDVQIIGETLYVLTPNDFRIYDIQNPMAPILVSTTLQGGRAFQVAGKYIFIADSVAGLIIYDIIDPNAPLVSGTIPITPLILTDPYDIYVSGAWVYIADGSSSNLLIVDISNPAAPFVRSQFTQSGIIGLYNAYGVFTRGKYAYIASDTQGLIIADVTNKNFPTFVSQVSQTPPGINNAKKVYVEGTKAYIADGINGMRIVDVANPPFAGYTAPTSLVPGGSVEDVYVAGNYAFMADNSTNGLRVVDVSVPGSPTVISSFTGVANNLNAVKVAGRYAWVAEAGGPAGIGLRAISLGGAQIASAEIAALQAGELNVIGNIISQGDLYVRDGAVFGGDVFVDQANLAVEGNVTVTNDLAVGNDVSITNDLSVSGETQLAGQMGIGTTTLDASAALQIDSTTQGFLGPRMTTAQRDAIVTPATGLQIFNTTTSQYEYYNGSSWQALAPSSSGGVFVGLTTNPYSSSITGYFDANDECDTDFPGSHICYASEIINSYNSSIDFYAVSSPPYNGQQAWVNNGPPAHPSIQSNDCGGWDDNTIAVYGSVWWFGDLADPTNTVGNGQDKALIHPCDQTAYKFACCM